MYNCFEFGLGDVGAGLFSALSPKKIQVHP